MKNVEFEIYHVHVNMKDTQELDPEFVKFCELCMRAYDLLVSQIEANRPGATHLIPPLEIVEFSWDDLGTNILMRVPLIGYKRANITVVYMLDLTSSRLIAIDGGEVFIRHES